MKKRRILAVLMAISMLMSFISMFTFTATADEELVPIWSTDFTGATNNGATRNYITDADGKGFGIMTSTSNNTDSGPQLFVENGKIRYTNTRSSNMAFRISVGGTGAGAWSEERGFNPEEGKTYTLRFRAVDANGNAGAFTFSTTGQSGEAFRDTSPAVPVGDPDKSKTFVRVLQWPNTGAPDEGQHGTPAIGMCLALGETVIFNDFEIYEGDVKDQLGDMDAAPPHDHVWSHTPPQCRVSTCTVPKCGELYICNLQTCRLCNPIVCKGDVIAPPATQMDAVGGVTNGNDVSSDRHRLEFKVEELLNRADDDVSNDVCVDVNEIVGIEFDIAGQANHSRAITVYSYDKDGNQTRSPRWSASTSTGNPYIERLGIDKTAKNTIRYMNVYDAAYNEAGALQDSDARQLQAISSFVEDDALTFQISAQNNGVNNFQIKEIRFLGLAEGGAANQCTEEAYCTLGRGTVQNPNVPDRCDGHCIETVVLAKSTFDGPEMKPGDTNEWSEDGTWGECTAICRELCSAGEHCVTKCPGHGPVPIELPIQVVARTAWEQATDGPALLKGEAVKITQNGTGSVTLTGNLGGRQFTGLAIRSEGTATNADAGWTAAGTSKAAHTAFANAKMTIDSITITDTTKTVELTGNTDIDLVSKAWAEGTNPLEGRTAIDLWNTWYLEGNRIVAGEGKTVTTQFTSGGSDPDWIHTADPAAVFPDGTATITINYTISGMDDVPPPTFGAQLQATGLDNDDETELTANGAVVDITGNGTYTVALTDAELSADGAFKSLTKLAIGQPAGSAAPDARFANAKAKFTSVSFTYEGGTEPRVINVKEDMSNPSIIADGKVLVALYDNAVAASQRLDNPPTATIGEGEDAVTVVQFAGKITGISVTFAISGVAGGVKLGILAPREAGEPETPNIFDALEVLKYLVKMKGSIITDIATDGTLTVDADMKAAGTISPQGDTAGEPTIFCALEILKWLVNMDGVLLPIYPKS